MNAKNAMKTSVVFAILACGSTVAMTAPISDAKEQLGHLQVAQTACRAHDFESFFPEFIASSAVRRRRPGQTQCCDKGRGQ